LLSQSTYSRHPKVSEDTSSLPSHDTSIPDLCGSRVAMHLRELELCLCAGSLREGGVTDCVSKGLSMDTYFISGQSLNTGSWGSRCYAGDLELFFCRHASDMIRYARGSYLSGSFAAKTFRLEWSRIVWILVKQPKSNFFARN
jgi:hypothetical protein